MGVTFLHDGDACYEAGLKVLSDDAPIFLSRIGGSDTNALISYLKEKDWPEDLRKPNLIRHKLKVGQFNGYYDKNDNEELYVRYCKTLYDCYMKSPHLIFCNFQLLSMYFKNSIHPNFYHEEFENKDGFRDLIDNIIAAQPDITCYPYSFIERVIFDKWNLFHVFSSVLVGKKVLVISPFAESIQLNFPNRHKFFKRGYQYPEFTLHVYNTPITYAGLPAEFYPDEDWFGTLERMKNEIANIDFDIALLSCGSYAMPLGVYIADELHRKAIYVGGILQIYFGITGRRYEGSFSDQINIDQFIRPIERDHYLKFFTINDHSAREAFGAYF